MAENTWNKTFLRWECINLILYGKLIHINFKQLQTNECLIINQYSSTHLPFSIKKIFNIIQCVISWKSFLQNKLNVLRNKISLVIPWIDTSLCELVLALVGNTKGDQPYMYVPLVCNHDITGSNPTLVCFESNVSALSELSINCMLEQCYMQL